MLGDQMAGYEDSGKNPIRVTPEDVDSLTLEDYGMGPADVKASLFGLKVVDPATQQDIDDSFYKQQIETAVAQVEQELDIAIFPRFETEYHDYIDIDYGNFMHTHVYKKPIIQVDFLGMNYNTRKMRDIPRDSWNVYHLAGQIEVLPSPYMNLMAEVNPLGLRTTMNMGLYGGTHTGSAPQMIKVQYVAGLLPRQKEGITKMWEIPATLERLVVKYAAKEVLQAWGNLVVQPGIANTSLSIDGISESTGLTQTATYSVISSRMMQLDEDIAGLTKALRGYFGGNMTSV